MILPRTETDRDSCQRSPRTLWFVLVRSVSAKIIAARRRDRNEEAQRIVWIVRNCRNATTNRSVLTLFAVDLCTCAVIRSDFLQSVERRTALLLQTQLSVADRSSLLRRGRTIQNGSTPLQTFRIILSVLDRADSWYALCIHCTYIPHSYRFVQHHCTATTVSLLSLHVVLHSNIS